MDHSLTHVSSQYGAPMGRRESRGDADLAYSITIRKVDLDQGGYDVGGAYWGTPNNLWRYFADPIDDSGAVNEFIRASNYVEVSQAVREAYPNATIIEDTIDAEYRETFIESYMDSAIEDGSHRESEEGDLDLDGLTSADLSDQARDRMTKECNEFIDKVKDTLIQVMPLLSAGDAGHNFYMSRIGAGVGFWDRGLGDNGDKLHDACKHREFTLYKGDDALIYQDG